MAIAAHDTHPLVVPTRPVASAAAQQAESGTARVGRGISYWALEGLRLMAVIYLLPLTILAVGIPLGLALIAMLSGAVWVWRSVW